MIAEPEQFIRVIPRTTTLGFGIFPMEEAMRRFILAIAATLSLLAAGSLAPDRAEALTVSTPAGIRAAIDETSLAQDVAYVCRRVWRCGYYGCGWRRVCWWTGRRYYRRYCYNCGRPYWRYRHWRYY